MANYTNHKNNKPLSKETVEEIRRRESRGEAKVHIAKALGISHSVVRKYTSPLPWRKEAAVVDEARRRLKLGHTRSEIARALGVSRLWVSQLSPNPQLRPNRIPENKKKELVNRVRNGEITAHVARDLGLRADTAYSILKACIELPDDKQVYDIKRQLSTGKSEKELAIETQLPLYVIRRIAGVKGSDSKPTDEEKQTIANLYSKGLTIREIAINMDCSTTLVQKVYKDALKTGSVQPRIELAMEDDRELLRIQRLYPELEEWRTYAVSWYKVVIGNFAVICSGINRFFQFLIENNLYEKPADFFLRQNAKLIPSFFEKSCSKSDHGAAMNNIIVDFLDWILLQPEFSDVSDDDVPTTLPMFRNPMLKVKRSDHKAVRYAESNKKVMPYWMIHDLRRRIAQGPSFRDWKWVQNLAGKLTTSGDKESRDWFEVSGHQIDKADPDCVWRIRHCLDGRAVLELWSPVRWVACLLKLQTTARMGQIRMLDSGEADTFIFDSGTFLPNQSTLATGTIRKPRRQGVLREGETNTLCLYFNTNKTADITKTGPEKGMECPWPVFPDHQDNPYYWIEKLRNWQAKYNPVDSAIAWKDIPSKRRLKGKSDLVCSTYPDAIFLFRTAENEGYRQFPVTAGVCDNAWQSIISEFEKFLDIEGIKNPDSTKIKLVSKGRSEISLHGLRVSLITHLILDGGVPPELMMKIVGHARFIMTIYYTKPGLQRLEDALLAAAVKLDATKDETLIRDLTSRSAEQIRNHVVFNAKELTDVIALNPADRNPLGWLPMHDGICLAGGNTGPVSGDARFPGCHNGGMLIDEPKRVFGPVPGGVRNCCRCRWKCAGQHHALGLQATLNNRQFHLHKASEAAIEAERKRNLLMKQKAQLESINQPFVHVSELRTAERIYEAAMHKMQELALDVAAVHRMIERIKSLPNISNGPTALAAQGDLMTLHSVLEETDSELLVLAEVCADVEFFPDLDPGTAIFEYAQLLDQAFEREGKPLILARMSEQEKLIASNAIMRELERFANPGNHILARRMVVEIMDRGESLQQSLGVNLRDIIQLANQSIDQPVALRRVTNEFNEVRMHHGVQSRTS